jgi:hypothetical protein
MTLSRKGKIIQFLLAVIPLTITFGMIISVLSLMILQPENIDYQVLISFFYSFLIALGLYVKAIVL